MFRLLQYIIVLLCSAVLAFAQDSRGTIAGTVRDSQGGAVPGAPVVVTNTDMNTTVRLTTNERGYFEAALLNAGTYSVSVQASGFKTAVRSGLQLNVAGRIDLDLALEIGQVSESIQVTAAAPLLDTTTASGGRVIDNRQITELPFTNMNPFSLTALAPGMQWTGAPQSQRPFDSAGTAAYNTMGGIGQNEYSIDGAPSNGSNRRVGFVPPSESVGEFKVETTPFDASYGFTSGAVVNVMTKAGTNAYHGSLFNQHWQQRWNATPHFTRLAWERDVQQGRISPDTPKQAPGRQNNFGGSLGGPVRIPGLFNGQDKLFFFASYNGIYQNMTEIGNDIKNNTVPNAGWRNGDFSDMLAVDPVRFTIYDPRSARREGSRVIRQPFPGNRGIPVLNPAYDFYAKLMPMPNNVPGLVSAEGFNNYLAAATPNISRFHSLINRIDYNVSDRHRLFGRWYWNGRTADTRDWLYETAKGLGTVDLQRRNSGIGGNYNLTLNSTTVLDIGINWTRFDEGNMTPGLNALKPTDAGLPAYVDAKADYATTLPTVDFANITDIGRAFGQLTTKAGSGEAKAAVTKIFSSHTLRAGYTERQYRFASSGAGYSSGRFVFNNQWTRQADNTNTASNHALDWAAFRMGVPSTITIDTNDTGYWTSQFRSLWVQDDWRLSSRLRLSAGLRYERETGIRERFNRGIAGGFLFDQQLPFTDAARAAYARAPLSEMSVSQFNPVGAVQYLADAGGRYTNGTHNFLPRIGGVYQVNPKTVVRAGYGWYYDTLNVNNERASQYGYSQPTNTIVSDDAGLTFCCGTGPASALSATSNPMANPFPVRGDGTRFDAPYGDQLGSLGGVGRSISFYPMNYRPAWQQRWRLSVQREITRDMVVEVAYNGARSRMPIYQPVNVLPQQYWATGMTRNQAIDDDLNRNVANPFNIANLSGLQQTDPFALEYLSTQTFFRNTQIRKVQLLRPYPHMSGLSGLRPGADFAAARGTNRYHDLQLSFERRFARGLQTAVMYTRAANWEADFYANEFDDAPTERPSDQVRPHRFVWTSIWELPFGPGKAFAKRGVIGHVAGGWQLSWIYQYQAGAPANWGNVFFYGDTNELESLLNQKDAHAADIHTWFNPDIVYRGTGAVPAGFTGFEGRVAQQPGQYHVRVFPTRLDFLRVDGIRNWDVKILRRFAITEGLRLTFSADLLNATNHTNFGAPQMNPTNSNFGRVTSQVGQNRFIQLNARIDF